MIDYTKPEVWNKIGFFVYQNLVTLKEKDFSKVTMDIFLDGEEMEVIFKRKKS